MINKVVLVGNLGRGPEIKDFENGSKLARFSIATNENYKDREGQWQTKTEWHEIVAWRMLADRAERSLTKGTLVYLEGKLRTRKWQDQNGQERRITEIETTSFRVINKNQTSDQGQNISSPSSMSSTNSGSAENLPPVEDDDLPF